jgi:hypothetical protein
MRPLGKRCVHIRTAHAESCVVARHAGFYDAPMPLRAFPDG